MQYFYLIPGERFKKQVVPALTSSWQRRNYEKIAELERQLSIDAQLKTKLGAFQTDQWRILVAETLLQTAAELPEIETPLESWGMLLGQNRADARGEFSLIQKAVLGSRDLFLGCYYRPENAGWNDCADVRELAAWLRTVRPETWRAEDLTQVLPEEREEELLYASEWFGQFTAMYERSEQEGYVVVCERI